MALPDNKLIAAAPLGAMLAPDSAGHRNRRIDYERGGVALQDPTQGRDLKDWRARVSDNGTQVLIVDAPYTGAETVWVTDTDIRECSLAFDQNMRPVVVYVAGTQAKLRWYDTAANAVVTTSLAADVRGPMVTLDDKRAAFNASSDVLLFYVRGQGLYYRQQRDRFTIERQLATFLGSGVRVVRAGMTSGLRMQVGLLGAKSITPV